MSAGPNHLFLIGAPKAGTTSLAAALARHPDIALARVKEPMHFTDFAEREWTGKGAKGLRANLAATREDYEAEFAHDPGTAWRLDASTDYLSCPVSPDRIAAFAAEPGTGRVQVAVLLRDPIERAVSQFQHTVRDGMETGTLMEALAQEEARRAAGAHPLFSHVARSRYAAPLAAWRARFPDLLILDYHRLGQGTEVLDRVIAALGLPPLEAPEIGRRNESHVYRSRLLGRAMRRGGALDLARRIVPKAARAPIRAALTGLNRTGYRPRPAEVAALRAALADDIRACLDDPAIPTDGWTTARGG